MAKKPENTITKIRTGYGDKGETFLVNPNVSKADPLVDFVGTLDEANAFTGKIKLEDIFTHNKDISIKVVNRAVIHINSSQNLLFDIGAAVHSGKVRDSVIENIDVYVNQTEGLINWVQTESEKYQKLNGFIYPINLNADAMIARTVIRRAEREAVKSNCFWAVPALNIMSDFFFLVSWMLSNQSPNQWTGVSTNETE